ncbi:SNF-related serine/threonine-protein kinase isoform X2 [Diachasma alloeum]|uniref:SNF-related serine/threonine-protein kinase isoform X2 n=1 Tax=Diachasma alloeum TaxID=454923 RepID=UPI000738289F|nr:SNF-related serine/threonine-protein kinase isoform X2 [Diachasma alloeum]
MHRRLGHSNYDGKIAGLYDLEETLGRGHFAVVKLARHVFTGEKVAVKVIDKSKLDEVSRAHLFQEVRCMKLVQHPNVVRLYEVIDTQTKLYLILELGDGGDLYDYIMRHDSGLTEELARTYFRQIVRAISYCHRLHVVHRDLKPENVVFFEKLGTVKLTDFGFSNRFCPGQKLETSCGSLAYSAPEILLGDSYDAPAVDVWSLGVILYMLVCGQAPFQEANDSETLTMIMDCKYSIPSHVSEECKRLIARMLVREPEGRATLEEIAADPWLGISTDTDSDNVEALPLVSRQQVSEEHHNLIITKMVNGNIATKEEILDALDKNEYNHITATYFLLAERKLRAQRQELVTKTRPELLNVSSRTHDFNVNDLRVDQNSLGSVNQSLLTVPRTPGDLPQNVRTRKCSIVQEEEDEDDVSSCSGRDDHASNSALSAFNRRGSRSEGKLSHLLQERLSQLPEKHVLKPPVRPLQETKASPSHTFTVVRVDDTKETPRPWRGLTEPDGRPKSLTECIKSGNKWRIERPTTESPKKSDNYNLETATTILTESSTAPSPLRSRHTDTAPKYKTMPSPVTTEAQTDNKLKEILEDADSCETKPDETTAKCRVVRRIGYEQKRNKFHKTRTTSCSSSDASDDDSENRKKRAHKLGATTGKPLPSRRDSHDDSSDSQEPGGNCGGARGFSNGDNIQVTATTDTTGSNQGGTTNTSTSSGGGKSQGNSDNQALSFSRRHRAGRRRAGETRLRESQSLNRITEVQEAETPVCHSVAKAIVNQSVSSSSSSSSSVRAVTINGAVQMSQTTVQRAKGFGARLLQGWSLTKGSSEVCNDDKHEESHKDEKKFVFDKENRGSMNKSDCKSRRIRLLTRYFAVHKKLCVPLPGFFGKGKSSLYKARSCGNISKDRVSPPSPKSMLLCAPEDKWRGQWCDKQHQHRGSDGDINQNLGLAQFVQESVMGKGCTGLPPICHIHLGDASKCCSLC